MSAQDPSRRDFLQGMFVAAGALLAADDAPGLKIIDTHTHFFDPGRPGGVPWPPKEETLLYRRTMPGDYRRLSGPLGVTGTVIVEASEWLEDNQWILDLADREPLIVGFVGHLKPGQADFAKHLTRFAGHRLFRGIRPRGQNPAAMIGSPAYLDDLGRLADADLSLDLVGGPAMLPSVLEIARRVPRLRIVIDHLPFDPPSEAGPLAAYETALAGLGRQANVYAKVSNVLRRTDKGVPTDAAFYREPLDRLWKLFGPDRVIYGSNWPVSNKVAPYADVQKAVMEYVAAYQPDSAERYFRRNSSAVYKWVERS